MCTSSCVAVVVSHIQRSIGCQPEKTLLHGGQFRSWFAEQGKDNKIKSLAASPPPHPPHCLFGEKKKKNHATQLQALRRSRSVSSRPYKGFFGSSTRSMGMCDNKFPSLVASLFSWRCLVASFLHAAMNLRPPAVTVLTHTSAFNAVAFH